MYSSGSDSKSIGENSPKHCSTIVWHPCKQLQWQFSFFVKWSQYLCGHLFIKEQVNWRPRANTTQQAGRDTKELCAAQSQHAHMKSLIHTHKNKAFAQPGAFSCHLSGKSHLACNLWCHPPHTFIFFKHSSQTSTSPLRGALTTYAQELLPSGMLHLNKICLCVATVLACQERA